MKKRNRRPLLLCLFSLVLFCTISVLSRDAVHRTQDDQIPVVIPRAEAPVSSLGEKTAVLPGGKSGVQPAQARDASGLVREPETKEPEAEAPPPSEAGREEPERITAEAFQLQVPYISQEGLLPTGCETVSALMVLRYYGYSTTVAEFVEKNLEKGFLYEKKGDLYGPHPSEAFIGSPYSEHAYGCFAPVIVRALEKEVGTRLRVTDGTGLTLEELMEGYVREGKPVLIWASMNMCEVKDGNEWRIESTGENFVWPAGEHCLVLIGEDADRYWFNDPYQSNGVISYKKNLVRSRFQALGAQSVIVEER